MIRAWHSMVRVCCEFDRSNKTGCVIWQFGVVLGRDCLSSWSNIFGVLCLDIFSSCLNILFDRFCCQTIILKISSVRVLQQLATGGCVQTSGVFLPIGSNNTFFNTWPPEDACKPRWRCKLCCQCFCRRWFTRIWFVNIIFNCLHVVSLFWHLGFKITR